MSATRQMVSPFGLVVIAASAGGIAAVGDVVGSLASGFPAGIVVVQHRASRPDYFAELLARRSQLPIVPVCDGDHLMPGHVHVAPAIGQVLIDAAGRFAVVGDDPGRADGLMSSAAAQYRERAIAVVLTGRGDDGSRGVRSIKHAHGRVLVQDGDASAPSMPQSAAATGCADFVLPLRVIGWALTALTLAPGGADLFKVRTPTWASTFVAV